MRKYSDFKEYLNKKLKEKNIVLFGMGGFAQATADELKKNNYEVAFFVDNNEKKEGTVYNGIKCISYPVFKKVKENYLVLIAVAEPSGIIKQLKNDKIDYIVMQTPYRFEFDKKIEEIGMDEVLKKLKEVKEIVKDRRSIDVLEGIEQCWMQPSYDENVFRKIYDDDQYFPEDIIKMKENTVFVDCGASIGESLESFLKHAGKIKNYDVILFELNRKICEELEANVKKWVSEEHSNIRVINKGCSDKNEILSYVSSTSSSHVDDNGNDTAEIVALDTELENEVVTFIKMDIEGFELKALNGAKKIIKKNHPDLAICLYHKLEDMWQIPKWIKKINPRYDIYVRHHTKSQVETVCYAVYNDNESIGV